MKRINPIYLLIAFNIVVFVCRDLLLPEGSAERFGDYLEGSLAGFGLLGYVGVLVSFFVCAFFFIPLLIPLNILCGAVYGPYAGTALSIVGITLGCFASTLSVRHVFKGMQRVVDKRPAAQKMLAQVSRYGDISVIFVRLAFVVPYLLQNIVLGVTRINIFRLTLLTAIGSLPGAAIYSFLGAGLMRSDSANELALYLAVPLLLFLAVSLSVKYLNARLSS